MAKHFLQINLKTNAETERRTYEGREHLVVPAIPIQEGVMNNVFYPAAEIQRFAEGWDGRPIPVGHPKDNAGNYISANSPEVLREVWSIGNVFDTDC